MTASKIEFKRKLDRALSSERLRIALQRAMPALGERRNARMAEVDWPALRDDLTARKQRAIDDLPALIERFTREAEAVGAKVYRAENAEEARRIVTANPGCQMQIEAGLRAAGSPMPVLHLMDVLDRAYRSAQ